MQEGRLRRLLSVEAEIITEAAIRGAHTTPVDVDAVLAIRFDAADSALVHCRLLQCSGVGVDGIAFAALPQDCIVANVHEHEIPVAEYVMLGILEHRIGMATMVAGFSNAAWGELFRRRVPHGELAGATLGLVGMGRIGKAIATRARAFGMRVLAVTAQGDPFRRRTASTNSTSSTPCWRRQIFWCLPARSPTPPGASSAGMSSVS